MKSSVFALMDCNSFYCSCERVFRPELRDLPVVVLSNNDGCIISLTPEAKALGVKMGGAYFENKEVMEKHGVHVFSSNYTLYGDLSSRVMSLLSSFTPELEIYSIDEAFLDFSELENFDLEQYSHHIRHCVQNQTGIPISIGLAPTKVLAKVANHIVKRDRKIGVFSLMDENERERILKDFPVENIWGIGRNSAPKLHAIGIRTAKDLRDYNNDKLIQKILTKTGRKIQDELRGINCIELTDMKDKKVIASTRSFGTAVYTKQELKEAVSNYITAASEKMRAQENLCQILSIYIRTSQFNNNYYCGQASAPFETPTDNTLQLIQAGHALVDQVYKPGFSYRKAGIFLFDMIPAKEKQLDLLSTSDSQQKPELIKLMDQINQRYGKLTIKSAACGTSSPWKMLSEHRSPCYTTSWNEIARVK